MTEAKLKKLDSKLNFYIPKTSYSSSTSDKKTITVTRYVKAEHENPKFTNNRGIQLSKAIIQLYKDRYKDLITEETTIKGGSKITICPIAFSFSDGENYAILNPSGGVPHFNIKARENGGNELNNTCLNEDLFDVFHVDKLKVRKFIIELEYFVNLQGLDLYKMKFIDSSIVPIEPNPKTENND